MADGMEAVEPIEDVSPAEEVKDDYSDLTEPVDEPLPPPLDEPKEEEPTEEPAEPEPFDYLSTVKAMLNIADEEKDKNLSVWIEVAKRSVLNFCNIGELLPELNFAVCQIAADAYSDATRKAQVGKVTGNVSSVSEDGRSVSFTTGAEMNAAVEDRVTRTVELRRFKKLYRL